MTCRAALSARLDGESEPVAVERTDEHLLSCVGCQSWHVRAGELTRSLRVRAAVVVPDLSAVILANAPAPEPAAGWRTRGALAAVAAAQVALGLSQLFGAGAHGQHNGPVVASHLFNESTAWNLALGVGMFWAAFRPRATAGLIPVLAGFVAVLSAYSVNDLIAGTAPVSKVVGHGLLVVGLCLMIAVNRRHRAPAPDGARRDRTHLAATDAEPAEPAVPVDVTATAGRPHLRPASRHRAA